MLPPALSHEYFVTHDGVNNNNLSRLLLLYFVRCVSSVFAWALRHLQHDHIDNYFTTTSLHSSVRRQRNIMPQSPLAISLKTSIYSPFNLKNSQDENDETEEERASPRPKQGRMYGTNYSQQPGGIKVEDMIFGVKMAHLSCTDDSEKRLTRSGPNTIFALERIVGAENTHKPLSLLLKEQFNLQMNTWISHSGFFHGRPVDTQGFVASNESTIVLSFRFSTSIKDWLTNLSMSSSEWQPDKDEVIGHAGNCSCFWGWYTKFFTNRPTKPRVHTGFYNNFVHTIPDLREYILKPLLAKDATPKQVFICGCSLGAAMATMAFCFILQEMQDNLLDPNFVNHKLISVTAGCPRAVDDVMRQRILTIMKKLRPLDRAVLCRLVYNHDLVPHIPFNLTSNSFTHLDKLVYITEAGDVIINPKLEHSSSFAEVQDVFYNFWASVQHLNTKKAREEEEGDDDNKNNDSEGQPTKTAFELECETTPEPIKDHMAYWYLTFLEKLKEKLDAGEG